MTRTIVIIAYSGNNYDVIEDGRVSDHLAWDEMLGNIASMTHPKINEPRYKMDSLDEIRDKARKGIV